MAKEGKYVGLSTKEIAVRERSAHLSTSANAGSMATVGITAPKAKSKYEVKYEMQLMGPVPQAGRAKSARPQGAVRAAGGVGGVTFSAVQVVVPRPGNPLQCAQ